MTDPESPVPSTNPQPPTPRSGERVLAGLAVVVGSILVLAAYSPRFTSRPLDHRPGEAFVYRIDLNRADRSELMQVPRIGPGLADAIIAERNAGGEFVSPKDLDRVKGFGPKLLEQANSHVIVNGTPATKPTATGKLKPGDPPLDNNTASEA